MPKLSWEEGTVNTRALPRTFLSCDDLSLFCELWDLNRESSGAVKATETTVIIQSELCTAQTT